MNIYIIIGIILVVTVVRILWKLSTTKKSSFTADEVQTIRDDIENRKFESDLITESSFTDPLIWTVEQEAKQLSESEVALSKESQEIIQRIIDLPHDFNAVHTKSQNQLVEESGYCENYEQITEGMIREVLETQSQRTEEWLLHSEDQRTPEGWFLISEDSRHFVGIFTTKAGYKKALIEYLNLESACAAYIKREIEYSRKNLLQSKRVNKRK